MFVASTAAEFPLSAVLVYLRCHVQMLQEQGAESWTARGHKSGRGTSSRFGIVLSGRDRV